MEHKDIEARSLAMHVLIAEKIAADPSLLNKVTNTISRWKTFIDPASIPYLDAWQKIIDQGLDAALSAATDPSEFGAQMRQSTPFVSILSQEERAEFLKRWRLERALLRSSATDSKSQ